MKTLIGIMILVFLANVVSKGQSLPPAKVHFLNVMVGINAEITTTIDKKKPIQLKSRRWVVVQVVGDSLGFVIDGKPYFVHFEPNKQYYFVVQASYGSRPVITEKSEREFILTAAMNSVKGPEYYDLARVAN